MDKNMTPSENYREQREKELIKITESWTKEDLMLAILDAEEAGRELQKTISAVERGVWKLYKAEVISIGKLGEILGLDKYQVLERRKIMFASLTQEEQK